MNPKQIQLMQESFTKVQPSARRAKSPAVDAAALLDLQGQVAAISKAQAVIWT